MKGDIVITIMAKVISRSRLATVGQSTATSGWDLDNLIGSTTTRTRISATAEALIQQEADVSESERKKRRLEEVSTPKLERRLDTRGLP